MDGPPAPESAAGVAQSLIEPVAQARTALDAELMVSHLVGMVRTGVEGDADNVEHTVDLLLDQLVIPLETIGSAGALAVLRLLSHYGSAGSRARAADAAGRLAGSGVADVAWAGRVGRPEFLRAWRNSDPFGSQDSMGVHFTDRGRDHTLMVLIDHDLGGGLKDAWVAEGAEAGALRQRILDTLADEPDLEFADLDVTEVARALRDAVAAPPCPVEPDQVEDVAANLELVRVRARRLCELAGIEPTEPLSSMGARSAVGTLPPSGPTPAARRSGSAPDVG
ncbi:MAG: hypothetical protein ACRCYX_05015 [Dermatophilaceae bacterium]